MSEYIGKRYQITKLIGKGGMAEVYLAWDTILKREVAVKILKSDMADDDIALERFKREAGATTQLSHPNIVDVYDVGDDGDKHYIVMEYVKGYTLKQLIKKRGAIPYKEAVWMMKQLAGALMEAHRKGIIHRDIKSQNVLIKPDGTIKLSDFGIALANGSMQITHKDSVLGSVHYLAPELSKGKQANMQSDIYSLGIVFYELLTGDVPFKAEAPIQVALMHIKNTIPRVRSINSLIPQSVENIILLATAKSLNNRYKNIALMLQDLNECLKDNHKFDLPINFDNNAPIRQSMIAADENNTTTTSTIIKKKGFKTFYFAIITVMAIVLLVAILFLSGIISPKSKFTTIPDITNLTVLEARDILNEHNLVLDEARIEYELSDYIEKDKIISVIPSVDSEIERNSKVKIVVSRGIYSVLENYIGEDYKIVEEKLKAKNFFVRLIPVESDAKQGSVVNQSLQPGYKYDSSINNEIRIEYSSELAIILDPDIRGMDINLISDYFSNINTNLKYELRQLSKETFTIEELGDLKENTVIKTEPSLGSSYTQTNDSKIVVYYYVGG